MESKKIGVVLLMLAVVVGFLLLSMGEKIQTEAISNECFQEGPQCDEYQSTMTMTHVGIGTSAFLLALGVYILLFYKGEKEILARLEEEKAKKLAEGKLEIMLKMLDEAEQKILQAIVEQDGIEQNTLKLRTGLSKSKVSEVLQAFERRGLIAREKKGKTLKIYLKEEF